MQVGRKGRVNDEEEIKYDKVACKISNYCTMVEVGWKGGSLIEIC